MTNQKKSRKQQVEDRRESLLEAAITVIAQHGLSGTTISSIAKEAGCSFGVVSFHFQSKEGIIFAALDHAAEQYEDFLRSRSEAMPGARIRSMIESDFDGRVSSAKRLAVWVSFWAEAIRVEPYRKRCAEMRCHYFTTTRDDVAALAALRGITVDAAQVSASLNAMIDGYWINNLLTERTGPEGQAAAKDACLTYMRGIFPDDF
ncbi:TetR family transcriptional regulator C-terminal domain-containing protein [Thioclava kandeliae]|uniref:TetR family transcriptional regulator C-terminal domain-containing protein n=1 Tax=Thioclava kandeliae TaxID=3070818 RepID=A0ABV1SLN5_9RHOB